MDACIELLLPEMIHVAGLQQSQRSFTWGGVSYAQGPGSYHWGDFVELVQTPIPGHFGRYLPANYITEKWIALSIRGKGLDMMQMEVNGAEVDWKGKSLDHLLRLLLPHVGKWVLVFELHCDQIDQVYELDVDQCLQHLQENLRREAKAEGFLVIPPMRA
jgi:hypothetical protein